jgi:mannose-6-phosphate isomerase
MIYTFKPQLKQTIWGGNRIIPFKHLADTMEHVGESWEVSGVAGAETVVTTPGPDCGKPLNQLVAEQQHLLVGRDNYRRFGNEFPLLVKFIDACHNLSVQVHPDDETARRYGHKHGKTEMWYVLDCLSGAVLYNGFGRQLTPEQYLQAVASRSICDTLACHAVHPGDAFFIPAGRIHAIGAGCFVVEIQQTSDVTYRIYDYGRRDQNGQQRPLHTDQAAQSLDYRLHDDYRLYYQPRTDCGVQLISCPHFTTAVYSLTQPMTLDYSSLDSFVILMAVKGEGTLAEGSFLLPFSAGTTVLLPATTAHVTVSGTVTFLETYI